ncbi:c-di-GMP-binding flagellar brake protein YcgR [Paenibacillus sp. 1182]|uniref:hypothetical protein n=1 Tax=Paenibacillus sp. 1182 TaxID=2806565 RepID=UPI001AE67283|nr:hypothetical protein [Paenibacillus sp. 1182]MBP1308748.1 c-di-GMP-binding flagellar brake protein YcgR [Paenibacillus sp. 1182]
MLGRMYRPTKITKLSKKRGYEFQIKYKSNFLGMYEFKVEIYLDYDVSTGKEQIVVDVQDVTIPLVISKDLYELISEDEAQSKVDQRKVSSFRVMRRPTNNQLRSTSDQLRMQMTVHSEKYPEEGETFSIELKPVVIENREYMWLRTDAITQVSITTNTTLKLREQ